MGFSAKATYGLLALMALAELQPSGGRLQVAEIAARQGIPERYLEQMMTGLRRAGLLRSSRGPRGGYQLARPAEEIDLATVLRALEGEGDAEDAAPLTSERQVLSRLGAELRRQRLARLEAISLVGLLEQRDALVQAQTMYFI